MDGRVFAPRTHVKACDFLGFVEYFFLKLSTSSLPVVRAKQLGRSMKETASCKKATELPARAAR